MRCIHSKIQMKKEDQFHLMQKLMITFTMSMVDKKLIQKNMWFLKMKVKLNVNITKLITDKLNERKL